MWCFLYIISQWSARNQRFSLTIAYVVEVSTLNSLILRFWLSQGTQNWLNYSSSYPYKDFLQPYTKAALLVLMNVHAFHK